MLNWMEKRRLRARLRLVEQNFRASTYLEDLAWHLGEPDLADEARELWNDIHIVQFCVEDSGKLDPATEQQQRKINRDLRRRFDELRGHVKASFDALFAPRDGWDAFYRMRGL